ncbi:hypothetical protein Ddc_24635 [Ditylenchus destructor]|nr:hypothetical protein Ddc_24635 [Ditylenchus destructor]
MGDGIVAKELTMVLTYKSCAHSWTRHLAGRNIRRLAKVIQQSDRLRQGTVSCKRATTRINHGRITRTRAHIQQHSDNNTFWLGNVAD